MWQLAAMAGAKALGGVANYYMARKNKTPGFQKSAYGKLLKERSTTGTFTPGIQRKILSGASRNMANTAYQSQQDIKGYLTARGMENSISGASLLSQPRLQMQENLASTSEDLDIRNELSKLNAQEQFAQGIDQTDAIKRQEKQGAMQNLIGDITGSATGYLQGRMNQQQQQMVNDEYNMPSGFMDWSEDDMYAYTSLLKNQKLATMLEDLWLSSR